MTASYLPLIPEPTRGSTAFPCSENFLFSEVPGERVICVLTAGNLAVTQSVISQLEEGLDDGGEEDTLYHVASLSDAAKMVGRAVRNVRTRDEEHLKAESADASASFIVSGQIKGRRMRLFLVYSAGNYIEATDDTP